LSRADISVFFSARERIPSRYEWIAGEAGGTGRKEKAVRVGRRVSCKIRESTGPVDAILGREAPLIIASGCDD